MQNRFMLQVKGRLILSLAFLGVFAMSAYAKTPTTEEEIPVYPGAVQDQKIGNQGRGYLGFKSVEDNLISSSEKIYRINASAEDVFKFYLKELGGTENVDKTDVNYDNLKPGTASQIRYDIDSHALGNDEYDKELKSVLAKARTPYKQDKWISNAHFPWAKKGMDGRITRFEVSINDRIVERLKEDLIVDGAGSKPKLGEWKKSIANGYKNETEVIIKVQTYITEEELRKAVEEKINAQEKEKEKEYNERVNRFGLKAPTEDELDVPLYAGAQYSKDLSVESGTYTYTSKSPIVEIVNFYKTNGQVAENKLDDYYTLYTISYYATHGMKEIHVGEGEDGQALILISSSSKSQSNSPIDRKQILIDRISKKVAFRKLEQERKKKMADMAANPPKESDLGVPIYPAAKIDPERTTQNSATAYSRTYTYLTDDMPEKIVAFYENKVGNKAILKNDLIGQKYYLIPLSKDDKRDKITIRRSNPKFEGINKTIIDISILIQRVMAQNLSIDINALTVPKEHDSSPDFEISYLIKYAGQGTTPPVFVVMYNTFKEQPPELWSNNDRCVHADGLKHSTSRIFDTGKEKELSLKEKDWSPYNGGKYSLAVSIFDKSDIDKKIQVPGKTDNEWIVEDRYWNGNRIVNRFAERVVDKKIAPIKCTAVEIVVKGGGKAVAKETPPQTQPTQSSEASSNPGRTTQQNAADSVKDGAKKLFKMFGK